VLGCRAHLTHCPPMLELQLFAMNTNTLAVTLDEKLRAVKAVGFGAIVL